MLTCAFNSSLITVHKLFTFQCSSWSYIQVINISMHFLQVMHMRSEHVPLYEEGRCCLQLLSLRVSVCSFRRFYPRVRRMMSPGWIRLPSSSQTEMAILPLLSATLHERTSCPSFVLVTRPGKQTPRFQSEHRTTKATRTDFKRRDHACAADCSTPNR